jgi:hypothetical protein
MRRRRSAPQIAFTPAAPPHPSVLRQAQDGSLPLRAGGAERGWRPGAGGYGLTAARCRID